MTLTFAHITQAIVLSLLMNVQVLQDHSSSSVRSFTGDEGIRGGEEGGGAAATGAVCGKRLTISGAGVAGLSLNHPWPNWYDASLGVYEGFVMSAIEYEVCVRWV